MSPETYEVMRKSVPFLGDGSEKLRSFDELSEDEKKLLGMISRRVMIDWVKSEFLPALGDVEQISKAGAAMAFSYARKESSKDYIRAPIESFVLRLMGHPAFVEQAETMENLGIEGWAE